MKDQSAEGSFISKIDCNFPYNDEHAAITLIEESLTLTTNATYMIIEELARIPASLKGTVSPETRLKLLDHIYTRFEHPLMPLLYDVAVNMINSVGFNTGQVLDAMKEIEKYPHQYCALNIVSFSEEEPSDEVETRYEDIVVAWRQV